MEKENNSLHLSIVLFSLVMKPHFLFYRMRLSAHCQDNKKSPTKKITDDSDDTDKLNIHLLCRCFYFKYLYKNK